MSHIQNKKAKFNYEILETLSAGIELLGLEVKSIREGKGSLEGAHVIVRGGEVFLVEAEIQAIQKINAPDGFDARRPRKLLLNKKEILNLQKKGEKKGLTIVPISLYNKGRKIKVEIAVVRGKKKFDKRESIKNRETNIEMRRSLKQEK